MVIADRSYILHFLMSQTQPSNQNTGMFSNPGGGDAFSSPRRPKPETTEYLLNGGPPVTQVVARTTLSVNAPEFVPKIYQTGAVGQSLSDQDGFVNSFGQMTLGTELMNYLINEFSDTMLILTTHPGNLQEFLRPLCDKLSQARTPDILHQVTEILYEQSVYEPNFRYTGARVCHFICNHLRDHPIFGQFKATFLSKCHQDFLHREQLLTHGPGGLEKLCGLTLFMGELFLNLPASHASGVQERLEFLAEALKDLLLTLLSQPNDICVKTVCQLLKLAGGPIEDSLQKKPEALQDFKKVFLNLQVLQSSQLISQNMQYLVKSVLDLRQTNWGRKESVSSVPSLDISQSKQGKHPNVFEDAEPIFYNIHGKPITREEAGYTEEDDVEEEEQYVLNEEEEREFLAWQAETAAFAPPNTAYPPPPLPSQQNNSLPVQRHNQINHHQGPPMYHPWSTTDGQDLYQSTYVFESYTGDDLLTMDDEAEAAYDEFLSSQHYPTIHK